MRITRRPQEGGSAFPLFPLGRFSADVDASGGAAGDGASEQDEEDPAVSYLLQVRQEASALPSVMEAQPAALPVLSVSSIGWFPCF